MEGVESKAESQGQDSQIMSENVEVIKLTIPGDEGFNQCVKELLKLIDDDDNITEMSVEVYYGPKWTEMITELARMPVIYTDENGNSVKAVSKRNLHKFQQPIKTEQAESSDLTSPQVTQTIKSQECMTPVDVKVNFVNGGGFAFSKNSDSDSESFKSINKREKSQGDMMLLKEKEAQVDDSMVLLKEISILEKEQFSLKKKIQDFYFDKKVLQGNFWSFGIESKAESQTQDSQLMSESVEVIELEISGELGFQQCVKEVFNLIEQDESLHRMKVEIYKCNKSQLTDWVTDLSSMLGILADQNKHLIEEVSYRKRHEFTTHIKTEQADSSNSRSPQVTQTSEKHGFVSPVDIDVTLNTIEGGFYISKRDDSESESFMSTNRHVDLPVKKDALKGKESRVHDPKVLLKKISTPVKQHFILRKKIQNLSEENSILEAGKGNVADLKLAISKPNRAINAMEKALGPSGHPLCNDLVGEILFQLPVKSLLNKRHLSKHWFDTIIKHVFNDRTPSGLFVGLTEFQPELVLEFVPFGNMKTPIRPLVNLKFERKISFEWIENSAFGVLLLRSRSHHGCVYHIYHSTIDYFKTLPFFTRYNSMEKLGMSLAFRPSEPHYYRIAYVGREKIIRNCNNISNQYEIGIFSSLTQSCRRSTQFSFEEEDDFNFEGGVYWEDSVHWVQHFGKLFYYNFKDESFNQINLPPRPLDRLAFECSNSIFSSKDKLLLVQRNGVMALTFDIHELKPGYLWEIRYKVDLEGLQHTFSPRPYLTSLFSVLAVVLETNNSSFVVIETHGLSAYRFDLDSKKLTLLHRFPEYGKTPKRRAITLWPDVHQYTACQSGYINRTKK